MLPNSQPRRPQITKPVVPIQQIRQTTTIAQTSTLRPKNQLEALPPTGPSTSTMQTTSHLPSHGVYDSASVHPVFFTQTLRRPPFPLPPGTSRAAYANPAAFGYIAEAAWNNAAVVAQSRTKL